MNILGEIRNWKFSILSRGYFMGSKCDPELVLFSFWKPEPVPPNDTSIVLADLQAIGSLPSVAKELLDIPRMVELPALPWPLAKNEVELLWEVESGVRLEVRQEELPPRPGEVLTIALRGCVASKNFYRLYVQVFERFSVTILDERSHRFYTPRDFRAKIA